MRYLKFIDFERMLNQVMSEAIEEAALAVLGLHILELTEEEYDQCGWKELEHALEMHTAWLARHSNHTLRNPEVTITQLGD